MALPETREAYEAAVEAKLTDFEAAFDKEDRRLADWIAEQTDEDFTTLLSVFADRLLNNLPMDKWFEIIKARPEGAYLPVDKVVGAILAVQDLRDYTGHSLNVFTDKPHYVETLTKVHKRLGKKFKAKVPEASPVRLREEAIAKMVVQDALERMQPEEVSEALKGSDLEASSSNQKKILLETLASGGVQALAKVLGKRVVKQVILSLLQRLIAQQVSKEAAKTVAEQVAKKFPQKAFRGLLGILGWVLLVKDVYDMGGEATRVTVPFVVNVAVYRTVQDAAKP